MRIAHIGLAAFFTDGMTYQDNYLVEQNVQDGHETLYISNAQKYENGMVVDTGYEDISLACGARLVRLPYVQLFGRFFSEKFRKVKGLYDLLDEFSPDVILCHDIAFWSVLDVIRYKKAHPPVKLYADTHTDYGNSGTNWLSLHVLHGIFYKALTQKALPYLEKYFILSADCRTFSKAVYHVPESLMEFYPLGGILPSDEEYGRCRANRRAELGITDADLLLLHSGKLEAPKRTEELLRAFAAIPNKRLKLCIIGSIPEDMKPILLPLMEVDSRVQYLGWKTGAELQEYLCACDFYCQPGSPSATMQNAVCLGCGIMLHDIPQYAEYFDHGNVIWVKTQQDIENTIRGIADGSIDLAALQRNSWAFARETLDYRKLAARLYR